MPNLATHHHLWTRDRGSRLRRAECPNCSQLVFCRERECHFDCHGFESYQLDCGFCRTPLAGIVDPADELCCCRSGAPSKSLTTAFSDSQKPPDSFLAPVAKHDEPPTTPADSLFSRR